MMADDKLVGVIGGMGPDATVDFMAKVIAMTPAHSDQEHVRMLVAHNPRIPSRQHAMQGSGEDPGPAIAATARQLEKAGADFLVMPCNAAHGWRDDVIAATSIPFISIIEESASAAIHADLEGGPVGILTTPACFSAGLYQHELAARQREIVMQSPEELAETMSLIDRIKAGDQSEQVTEGLLELSEQLVTRGAAVIIAACTELPLVLEQSMFDVPLVSSTDALAMKTVDLALGNEPLPNR